MDLKYVALKTSVQKLIDNTIHGYRIGVWDGFYGRNYKEDTSKGIDYVVYNYLYMKGYSFGDFLRQTDDEWDEQLEGEIK
tara:strand:+ start:246 stop:485 length:240 start_codon:yes stop_codon:yes gene_type:complete